MRIARSMFNLQAWKNKRNKPQSAGEILSTTLRRTGLAKDFERYSVVEYWSEVVGPELSRVSKPEKITTNGVLVIRVVDPNWSQELSMQKADILARLRKIAVGEVISDLRFTSGSPKDFVKK